LAAVICGGISRRLRDDRRRDARGSLVIDTDLGVLDARLAPQLDRLTETLREVLRSS
jgi:hypothetical protein